MLSTLLLVVCSAQLAWTDSDVVNIRVDRPDGQKLIVLKEGSDLHIICETPADEGVSAEWWFNDYTRLTSESDRVELTQRRATVDGQLKHEYVLIMRRTTTNDRGSYKCEFGSLSDEVNVKITKLAKLRIVEAQTSELYLEKVNGTYTDLTLSCVGEMKSQPEWKHNEKTVNETLDTIVTARVDRTSRRQTLVMTRHDVTERFAGRYQCVDARYFLSDSDILTVLSPVDASAQVIYPGSYGPCIYPAAVEMLLVIGLLVITVLTNYRL